MLPNTLPLVGRHREQASLRSALAEAGAGLGGLILLSGEAGVGKSSLVNYLLTEAGSISHAVGRCPGSGETPPFGPWLEAAGALAAAGVVRTTPPFNSRPLEGQTMRQMAVEVRDWLQQGAGPVLVILEDIHWSDPASLDLLRHLTGLLSRSQVLVVATYRSDEIQRDHPLWSLLPHLQHDGAMSLPVERLDAESVFELVDATLDLPAPRKTQLARELHRRTGGLPLMIFELMKSAGRSDGLLPAEGMLPGTVLQAIDLRLSKLSPAGLQTLTAAAFIGERFSYTVLAGAVELTEDELADALDEAVNLYLIRSEGAHGDPFSFDHALVREALLGRQIAPRRRRWHSRIAEALMRTHRPDPDAVAFHLSRADDPRGVEWLMASGDGALRLGALAQARVQYERALQLLQGPDRRRGELLLKLGHTVRHHAPPQAVAYLEEALDEATRSGDAAVNVWARHFLILLSAPAGDTRILEPMEQLATEQETLLGDGRFLDLETQLFGQPCGYPRIAGERTILLARSGQFDKALALCQAIRAVANPGPHLADLAYAEMVYLTWSARHVESRRSLIALRDARLRLKQYRLAASMQFNLYMTQSMVRPDYPDELDAVARELAEWEALAVERSGQGSMRGGYSPLGVHQFFRGDWDGARQNLVAYFREHPEDDRVQRRWIGAQLALAEDQIEEMRTIVEGCPPHTPDDPPGTYLAQLPSLAWRVRLYVASGELARAKMWLDAVNRMMESMVSDLWRPDIELAAAEFHQAMGDLETARDRALAALANARHHGLWLYSLYAWRAAGELSAALGDVAGSEEHFRQALPFAERCRMPLELARTQLAYATSLPHRPDAPALLLASRDTLAELGAARYLKQAESAIAKLTTAAPAGLATPLTAREVEVVRLVADGLSDRDIGARLFISPRTVDRHLRNVFAKLEITSRSALGAYAARHGLLAK